MGLVLGPRHAYAEKDSPYECGFEAFEDARIRRRIDRCQSA